MFFRKKESGEEVGPSRGAAAILHKTVMFLLYPLRKPLYFLMLLMILAAVAFCVPVFMFQVQPQQVPQWYLDKVKKVDTSVIMAKLNLAEEPKKGVDQLVEMPVSAKMVRRQIFEKASRFSAPQPLDIMAEEAADVVPFKPVVAEPEPESEKQVEILEASEAAADKDVRIAKKDDENGPLLRYLEEPEVIEGNAKVYNANEMDVGGTYVFLYGTYSNPKNRRGVKAAVFLRGLVKGEKVKCNILAYTRDDVATAECFVGNVSVNEMLVEQGLSDKVTLE